MGNSATGTKGRALFHPCHCSGSIRYVHQECLIEWLRVSKKDFCELCKHKFTFKPIYAADMPARIPVTDLLTGLFRSLLRAIGCWLHYTTGSGLKIRNLKYKIKFNS